MMGFHGKVLYFLGVVFTLAVLASLAVVFIGCSDKEDYLRRCFKGCPADDDQLQTVYVPVAGPAGQDGKGCTAEPTDFGVWILCGDAMEWVPNGAKGDVGAQGPQGVAGQDGVNGQDATSPVSVTLCGSTAPHAEVAIKVNGKWIAYFENNNGSNRRLTVLVPGVSYMSTDGFQTCIFTTADLDAML